MQVLYCLLVEHRAVVKNLCMAAGLNYLQIQKRKIASRC